jgi:hypothetical protein
MAARFAVCPGISIFREFELELVSPECLHLFLVVKTMHLRTTWRLVLLLPHVDLELLLLHVSHLRRYSIDGQSCLQDASEQAPK